MIIRIVPVNSMFANVAAVLGLGVRRPMEENDGDERVVAVDGDGDEWLESIDLEHLEVDLCIGSQKADQGFPSSNDNWLIGCYNVGLIRPHN